MGKRGKVLSSSIRKVVASRNSTGVSSGLERESLQGIKLKRGGQSTGKGSLGSSNSYNWG
jgi:hypothetical protein